MKWAVRTLVLALWALPRPGLAQEPGDDAWYQLMGTLQYLQVDYPVAIEEESEAQLREQRAYVDRALALARGLGPEGAPFVARVEELRELVHAQAAFQVVSRTCAYLVEDLVRTRGLVRSPERPPDLALAGELFLELCATCHGKDGSADTKRAKTFTPPPLSFLFDRHMEGLTAYRAQGNIQFGLPGTEMPAFDTLSPHERWSLAFYVIALRHPPCEIVAPEVSLQELAVRTDAELREEHGPAALACLRRNYPVPEVPGPRWGLWGGVAGLASLMVLAPVGWWVRRRRAQPAAK